jgi:hypothetical protein
MPKPKMIRQASSGPQISELIHLQNLLLQAT